MILFYIASVMFFVGWFWAWFGSRFSRTLGNVKTPKRTLFV
jgi:heme/copper-type cytochrome/quinol oxidase subunit 3